MLPFFAINHCRLSVFKLCNLYAPGHIINATATDRPPAAAVCLRFAFYSSAADRISEWPTASLSGSCSCKHRWMALPPFNGPSSLLILLHFIQFIGGGRSNNGQGNESKASFVVVILNGSSRVTIMALVCYEWQRMEP